MTTLEGLVKEFVADTKARGLSPRTTLFYSATLEKFMAFLKTRDVAGLEGLDARIVREYMGHCMTFLAPGGTHARLRAVRAFVGFLMAEELLTVNPFSRVKLPRVPEKPLDVVSDDQYRALMTVAALSHNSLRDQAILSVMFDTGIRSGELCAVLLEDVLRAEGGITIRQGKGGKVRFVPVCRGVLKRINQYVTLERGKSADSHLFFTRANEPLRYEGLRMMLDRHCTTAGIKPIRPHAFRRGFAVAYVRNGGDVFTLQRILGHTTLAMSSRYARMNSADVKDVHTRVSPVARGGS